MISPIMEVIHSPTLPYDKYLPHKIEISLHFPLLCNHSSPSTTIKFTNISFINFIFLLWLFFTPLNIYNQSKYALSVIFYAVLNSNERYNSKNYNFE